MDLRTVKHFIWKQGGTDLTLHYRLIGTKWYDSITTVAETALNSTGLYRNTDRFVRSRLRRKLTKFQKVCVHLIEPEDGSVFASPMSGAEGCRFVKNC